MSQVDLLSELDSLLREWWCVERQHEHYLPTLEALKVSSDDDQMKNKIWVRSTLLEGHLQYLNIFNLLKAESFYEGWCQLERLEILLANLRLNKEHVDGDYGQRFLTNAVNSWQALYPYRIFFSSREIIKKLSCSICNRPRSILQGCGHRKHKLYAGEICHDMVEEFEFISYDMVSNPVVKASVPLSMEGDHYDYTVLKAALQVVTSPGHQFHAYKSGIPSSAHTGVYAPSSPCPCMRSIKNYEDCCLRLSTLEADHINLEFYSPMKVSAGGLLSPD
ncbi:hypothetical protein NJH78_18720 [Pseudomonas chlororaphis]|uniref:hypothetical protein n=1 Tax=Pseudomonas chlororaphis TaxID=587753 RepID=UPI00209B712D|nr:hypothetical protein [Pseudomonas chlororaphis]MCO7572022.1 hypothetical protein [Pseudomonas chlororaphis]MCO7589802.1 hypothetical protein [Pseudomonas chlororaphis]